MKKSVEKALENYINAEEKLIEELSKLPRWANSCNCGSKDKAVVNLIYEGEYIEKPDYCIECGGVVE